MTLQNSNFEAKTQKIDDVSLTLLTPTRYPIGQNNNNNNNSSNNNKNNECKKQSYPSAQALTNKPRGTSNAKLKQAAITQQQTAKTKHLA